MTTDAAVDDARATLLRALERLDELAGAGCAPEVVVVAFAARCPGDPGEPCREAVGYEASTGSSYAREGLLRQVLRRVEAGG